MRGGTGHSRGIQDIPKPKKLVGVFPSARPHASAGSGIVCTWTPSIPFIAATGTPQTKGGKGNDRCADDSEQTPIPVIAATDTPPKKSGKDKHRCEDDSEQKAKRPKTVVLETDGQVALAASDPCEPPLNTAVVQCRPTDAELAEIDDALVGSFGPSHS